MADQCIPITYFSVIEYLQCIFNSLISLNVSKELMK